MVSVLRIGDVLQTVLSDLEEKDDIAYQLLDGSAPESEQLLYQSPNFTENNPVIIEEGLFGSHHRFQQQIDLPFGGRSWRLNISAGQHFLARHRSETTWLILVIGLLCTGLLGALVLIISGRDDVLLRLVFQRTAALQNSEKLLAQSQKIAHIGSWSLDLTTNSLTWSDEIYRIFGIEPQAFPATYDAFLDAIHPEDRERVDQAYRSSIQKGETHYECEHRIIRRHTGEIRYVYEQGVHEYDANNQAMCSFGNVQDITERKIAEAELQQAASVFTYANEGIMITDPAGLILNVNTAFCRLTGYSHDEVIGQKPKILSSGKHDDTFYKQMWQTIDQDGCWSGEIWNRRKNGELYVEWLTISAVYDSNQNIQRYVALFSDITHFKEHEKQLEYIAHYDALTDLPNRVLLADRIHQAMSQTLRRKEQIAIVYLDLDGFKAVNDTYGHQAGDQLLVTITQRMQHILREGDTLARLGGDEFVLVLLSLQDIATCRSLLNRLLESVAQPVSIDEHSIQVSASLGLTFFPQKDSIDADQLLRQADQAMYVAKQQGKNNYHLFDPESDRNIRNTHDNLSQIQQALQNQEFVLYYQPKVNLQTQQVIGAEALIRWQSPQQGLVPPGVFLPVIESHPFIIELGDWVIDTALDQILSWRHQGLIFPVSVNIAPLQLGQPDFLTKLSAALDRHAGIQSGDLELEILETSSLDDIDYVSNLIQACKAMGIPFSLDDFGTGYSSLTYLKHLPAETIKIDQSFVRDMLNDPNDQAILEGIINLTHSFHRQVIAEGIETPEHARMLLKLGCYLGQGYAIARPMPAEDIPQWITQWQTQTAWISADEN